ncbi:CbrC family protein [Clostridiales bacterium COT073_COT-073]|nr:CbrC family protein [Clostridiales bacterium COT073_COT-073]
MNRFLKEYIALKKQYELCDGNQSSVLQLYELASRLEKSMEQEAKEVLVDVYQLLGLMKSAYQLYSGFADKNDRKQLKKFIYLKEAAEKLGDDYALPKLLTELEKKQKEERLAKLGLPKFRYYPDPLGTGAFEEGEEKTCPCCGEKSTIYYSTMPYCIEKVENLCPNCIATGRAAEKYDAYFISNAEWAGERNQEKDAELFCRTPGYISWQGEYWLSCCEDYCEYLGTVGTRELKAMGIAEEVLAEYELRHEYSGIEPYLIKDGSTCGYLFHCLHCGKYHLWVDAD